MRRRLKDAGIVITRPGGANDRLSLLLAAEGARALPFPALRIVALDEPIPTDPFDAVLFTSPAAVRFGVPRLGERLPRLRLAPGQGTRETLAEAGVEGVVAPARGAGIGALLKSLPAHFLRDRHLLIVSGKPVNGAAVRALAAQAERVSQFATYRREAVRDPQPLADWVRHGEADVIMASSIAAVKALCALPDTGIRGIAWIASSARVAAVIANAGARVVATAASAEVEDMTAAVCRWWQMEERHERA